ncbi:hypothetical protein ACVJMZ_004994 [Sinorhizobium medicae]
MSGKVDSLVADAFLKAAVAGYDIGEVVAQSTAEPGGHHLFGHRHPDSGRDPLAQRAGGGLDAEGMAVFGMAGRFRAELPEGRKLGHRHVRKADEVMEGIEQHRAMAGRKHETVAVGPVGERRIDSDEAVEEHGNRVRHAHRHARMTGIGLLDGIHGKKPDGVGHVALRGGGAGFDLLRNIHDVLLTTCGACARAACE